MTSFCDLFENGIKIADALSNIDMYEFNNNRAISLETIVNQLYDNPEIITSLNGILRYNIRSLEIEFRFKNIDSIIIHITDAQEKMLNLTYCLLTNSLIHPLLVNFEPFQHFSMTSWLSNNNLNLSSNFCEWSADDWLLVRMST